MVDDHKKVIFCFVPKEQRLEYMYEGREPEAMLPVEDTTFSSSAFERLTMHHYFNQHTLA